jgi:glycerol-1-phosphate dehydrogenase [NAD(P)+]
MPREINDIDAYLSLDASELANSALRCPKCGKTHRVPIERIQIGDDLIQALPDVTGEIAGKKSVRTALIYDKAIEEIIREAVIDRLPTAGLELVSLGEKDMLLEPLVELGDAVADQLGADIDVIVGAGSGVIADLTKWIATKVNKPFVLYGTAPSMNAHTSITATMTKEGIKTSAWLTPARGVLFDVPILARSPKSMRLAGLGDLAARAICNADWKLGSLLRQKYFCPVPFELTRRSETNYLRETQGIGQGESQAVHQLGEAILLSGISMTMVDGETSPSSGCEHVFSHYWDLQVDLEGAPKNLHGTQVGIGTLLSLTLYDFMRSLDIERIDPQRVARQRPTLDMLKQENQAKFGTKAHLFDDVLEQKWLPDGRFVPYLHDILDSWQATWEALAPYIGAREALQNAFEAAGFVFSLDTIQRTRQQALDALIYGGRYRSRYTLLDLAWELGVLPDAAGEILDRSGLG